MRFVTTVLIVFLCCLFVLPGIFHTRPAVNFTELSVNHSSFDSDGDPWQPPSIAEINALSSELSDSNVDLNLKISGVSEILKSVQPFPPFPKFISFDLPPALNALSAVTFLPRVISWFGQVIAYFLYDLSVVPSALRQLFYY